MRYFIFCSGVFGVSLFVAASIIGGLQVEGYSFTSQYISESFSEGLPNVVFLRYMYIASGSLLLLFGFMVPQALTLSKVAKSGFYLFGNFYGLGSVTVALFPCDFGCPTAIESSSLSQLVHNASASFTYMVVPICLLMIGLNLRSRSAFAGVSKVSLICGALSVGFVVLLFGNTSSTFIGLFQRIIEGSILFWVIYCSFYVLKHQKNLEI